MFKKRRKRPRADINTTEATNEGFNDESDVISLQKVRRNGSSEIISTIPDQSKKIEVEKESKDVVTKNETINKSVGKKYKALEEDKFKIKLPYGPLKATPYIRVTTRFDYQPDICKEYKETGYCGYGDSCKFIHDRSDYKTGWEIEKEWEVEQEIKRIKRTESNNEVIQEKLPANHCEICKEEYVEPVELKCKHVYCKTCAINRYFNEGKKTCFSCQKETFGIFNSVKK